jgi:hypothetical protein
LAKCGGWREVNFDFCILNFCMLQFCLWKAFISFISRMFFWFWGAIFYLLQCWSQYLHSGSI